MKKDSYDFPSKRAYRLKFKEFVKKSLYFRQSKDIKVVCFPGQEGLEIIEVYDNLSIPRENIIGLERNHDIAQEISKNVNGINVVVQDALNFFKAASDPYDIINLDYQSQFGEDEERTIETICRKELLRSGGVLGTNFFGAREPKTRQEKYSAIANFHRFNQQEASLIINKSHGKNINYRLTAPREGLKECRDDGISQNLVSILGTNGPGFFYSNIIKSRNPELLKRLFELDPALNLEDIEAVKTLVYGSRIIHILNTIYFDTSSKLSELKDKGAHSIMNIFDYLRLLEEKPYLIDQHERYSYFTENAKAKMFCDFLQVSKQWYKWQTDALSFEVNGDYLSAKKGHESIDELLKKVRKFVTGPLRKFLLDFMPERIHLESIGDKEKPPKKIVTKEKISKEDAIDLLKSGSSPAEIVECYSGFTKMQLAAFKAHYVTMGKEV